jgi:hypothetical protein
MSSEQTLKQRKQLVDQLSRKGKYHAVVKALVSLYCKSQISNLKSQDYVSC